MSSRTSKSDDEWDLEGLLARVGGQRVEHRPGVAEHLAAHALLHARSRWSRGELGDALASLLARDRDEWTAVRIIFDQHCDDLDQRRARVRTGAHPPVSVAREPVALTRRRLGIGAAVGAVAVALLIRAEFTPEAPPSTPTDTELPAPTPNPTDAELPAPTPNPTDVEPPAPEPDLPRPILEPLPLRVVEPAFEGARTPESAPAQDAPPLAPLRALTGAALALDPLALVLALLTALAGLVLLSLARATRRADREGRRRDQGAREVLDAEARDKERPLPYAVERHPFFDRRALDDAATLLGRRHPEGEGPLLDVPRTVGATIRNLGHITPVQRPRLRQPPLLVLVDLCDGSHPYLDGVHQLLRRWRQGGLDFAVYSFFHRPTRRLRRHPPELDRDPNALMALAGTDATDPRPGPDLDLDDLGDRHTGARLLVFADLRRAVDDGERTTFHASFTWPARLAAWPRRVLLDLDPRPPAGRGPERDRLRAVEEADLPRFPLTDRGLVAAATYLVGRPRLAGDDQEPLLPPRAALARALELWAGAAAFVPDATWDQLEDLRRTFAQAIHQVTGVLLVSPHCVEHLISYLQDRSKTRIDAPRGLDLHTSGLAPDLRADLCRAAPEIARAVVTRLRDQLEKARADHEDDLSEKQRKILELRRDFHDARLDPDKLRAWLDEYRHQGLDDFIDDYLDEVLDLDRRGIALSERPPDRGLVAVASGFVSGEGAVSVARALRTSPARLFVTAPVALVLVAVVAWIAAPTQGAEPPAADGDRAGRRYHLPAVYELALEPACPRGGVDDPPTGGRAPAGDHTVDLGPGVAPMQFISLEGGEFTMGSPKDEVDHEADETRHRVCLTGFDIAATEVTVAQYRALIRASPSDCDYGCADTMPVQNVSWEDSVRFANALTDQANRALPADAQLTRCYEEGTWAWKGGCTGYRLPTEAEWEYAARAGSGGKWSFGEDEQELCTYANVADRSAKKEHPDRIWLTEACDDGVADLAPVGRYAPNRWGLYDMHGNVWEWVYDWYDEGYYGAEGSKVTNPVNMTTGARVSRVLRGGSFCSRPVSTRSANRDWYGPSVRNGFVGLRCVRGRAPSMAP